MWETQPTTEPLGSTTSTIQGESPRDFMDIRAALPLADYPGAICFLGGRDLCRLRTSRFLLG